MLQTTSHLVLIVSVNEMGLHGPWYLGHNTSPPLAFGVPTECSGKAHCTCHFHKVLGTHVLDGSSVIPRSFPCHVSISYTTKPLVIATHGSRSFFFFFSMIQEIRTTIFKYKTNSCFT